MRIIILIAVIIVSLMIGLKEGFECCRDMELTGQAAVELSGIDSVTWGSIPYFADRTAKWIWSTPQGLSGVPINSKPIKFVKAFENNQHTNLPVRIDIIVDDFAAVKINGAMIGRAKWGWAGMGTTILNGTFLPGRNVIEIKVRNTHGPAGFVASVFTGSSLLFHTDSSWKWSL